MKVGKQEIIISGFFLDIARNFVYVYEVSHILCILGFARSESLRGWGKSAPPLPRRNQFF